MSRSAASKWLARAALVLLSVALVLLVAATVVVQSGLNEPGGRYHVTGLDDAVTIRFDERLRPWVEARSLDDALWAEGWLHARYRLWQMELLRRAGRGRLAAGLGSGMLETDRSLWRAGVPQLAENLERGASGTLLEKVDAYLAGINAAIDETRSRPPEFWLAGLDLHHWTRRDVFAVGAIIAFQSANNQDSELLRLALAGTLDEPLFSVFLPDEHRSADFPYILQDPQATIDLASLDALDTLLQPLLPSAALGSSGWVVAPKRSASGNVLFAFDSHDDLSLPNLFFEVHLFYGPERSIRGWSLPGLPGVINGFNQHLAWGLTNIGDTQDLFLESRHPTQPDRFEWEGDWYQARSETVEIPVKGREQPERLTVLHTRNGPLVSEDPPLSLRWTGHDLQGRGMESLLAMNTADDLDSFEAALDRHGAPSANITYGDRDGHILFRSIGLIPLRGAGKGLFPQPGDSADNQWLGMVPNEEMPHAVDPEQGYLAAANARVHADEPLISADNAAGYRMQRLRTVLASRHDFELDDMQSLQVDFHNSQAEKLLPHLLPSLHGFADGPSAEAVHILRLWAESPVNDADSAGALIWEHWYPELAHLLFARELDPKLLNRVLAKNYLVNHALDRLIVDETHSPWWNGEREQLLRDSFQNTVELLVATAGPNPQAWRWDQVQKVHFKHELDGAAPLLGKWLSRGPVPWGGGHPVLGRARYRYDKPFTGRMGATVRVVAELAPPRAGADTGDMLEVRAIIPGGQHGHPSSAHYDDQLQSWLRGQLDTLAGVPSAVDDAVTHLLPAK